MSDNYKVVSVIKLNSKGVDIYTPIDILGYTLIKDDRDNAYFNIQLRNVTADTVSAVELELTGYNALGDLISVDGQTQFKVVLQNMCLDHSEIYYNDRPLILPSKDVCKLTVSIVRAMTDSDKLEMPTEHRYVLPQLEALEKDHLRIANGLLQSRGLPKNAAVCYPFEGDGYWVCTCGRPNRAKAERCCICGMEKTIVLSMLTREYLERLLEEERELNKKRAAAEEKKQREAVAKREEWERLEREKAERQRIQKNRKVKIACVIAAAIVAVTLLVLTFTLFIPRANYDAAVKLMTAEDYRAAAVKFELLGDRWDSVEMYDHCIEQAALENKYIEAVASRDKGEYVKAGEQFAALGNYKDSNKQEKNCWEQEQERKYDQAIGLLDSKDFDNAKIAFAELGGYKDSMTQMKEVEYRRALNFMNEGKYEEAIALFIELGDYKDSEEQVEDCKQSFVLPVGDSCEVKTQTLLRGRYTGDINVSNVAMQKVSEDKVRFIINMMPHTQSETCTFRIIFGDGNTADVFQYVETIEKSQNQMVVEADAEFVRNSTLIRFWYYPDKDSGSHRQAYTVINHDELKKQLG